MSMEEGEKIVVPEQEFRKRFIYDQDSLLGEGGFAKVYKAYDRQFDETVALKFFTKSDLQKYDIISEMRNSRRFTHKNIIRVHDARVVRFVNSFGIAEDVQVGILEYANAGNLQDFLDTAPSEEEFKQVMLGILQGLNYLHTEKRVIHRDLSPDNVLMIKDQDQWIPKIADFGISKQIDIKTMNMGGRKVSSELVGKMEYMAPEQFDPKKYGINGQITTNVDLWSFGVILTEVFTESSPFGDRNTAQSPMQIMHNVLHNPIPSEVKKIPEPYSQMIKSCLIKDANRRVQSSQDLINILSTYRPRKKRLTAPWMAAALISLVLLAALMWYFYSDANQLEADSSAEASLDSQEESPVIIQPTDSVVVEEDSNKTDNQGSTGEIITPTPEEEPVNTGEDAGSEADSGKPPLKINGNPKLKAQMMQDLYEDIKLLNDDMLNINLRKSRINNYIDDYFTSKNASVMIHYASSEEQSKQQDVESFLNYVVNTADIAGARYWEIDEGNTQMIGNKISSLSLKQY